MKLNIFVFPSSLSGLLPFFLDAPSVLVSLSRVSQLRANNTKLHSDTDDPATRIYRIIITKPRLLFGLSKISLYIFLSCRVREFYTRPALFVFRFFYAIVVINLRFNKLRMRRTEMKYGRLVS